MNSSDDTSHIGLRPLAPLGGTCWPGDLLSLSGNVTFLRSPRGRRGVSADTDSPCHHGEQMAFYLASLDFEAALGLTVRR